MAQVSPLMFDIMAQDRSRAAFDSAGRNADSLAAKARKAANDTQTGMNAARGSVANLAAQFQDIGVQLAGGQSPFLIALQQGSQITGVLGQSGAAGAVQLLGSAFASLLSPVSLVTIATIAAGGAAIQYFADLISAGAESEDTLRKQEELIAEVAKQWGGAVPALKEYVDQLERAKEQTDLISATETLADRQWTTARDAIAELNIEFVDLKSRLEDAGTQEEVLLALQDGWNSLNEAVKDGRADQEAMQQVTDQLAAAMAETAVTATEEWTASFGNLSQAIAGAAQQASRFREEALQALTVGENGPSLNQLSPLFSENGRFMTNEDFTPFGNAPIPTSRGTPELSGFPSELNSRGSSKRKTDAEREAESYQKLIQSLEDEQAMIGRSNAERRILQLQRRANVDAATAEGQAIEALVRNIDAEQEAYKQAEKAGEFMRSNLQQSIMDMIPEIETGNKALDGFINRLIEAAAQAAFFGSGPLGNGGGGIFGSLFSGFSFGGGRAVGGAVEPFTDYQVGEDGPEIVRIGARGGSVQRGGSNGGGFAPSTIIINNNAPVDVKARETEDERGGRRTEIIIDESVAKAMNSPGSATRKAMRGGFGVAERVTRR